jgi:hypothetical protein
MDPAVKLSKKYAEDADYFSDLLAASHDHIKPEHVTKFEAIIAATKKTAAAYAVLAMAPSESARQTVNRCVLEIDRARAAFAAF